MEFSELSSLSRWGWLSCRFITRSSSLHQNVRQSVQEQHQIADPGCRKISFQCATRMSCGGCETAKPTCKMQRQREMPTSWRGCAKLWPPQHRSCHRWQRFRWSQTRSGVVGEQHQWWDYTAQCGEISVRTEPVEQRCQKRDARISPFRRRGLISASRGDKKKKKKKKKKEFGSDSDDTSLVQVDAHLGVGGQAHRRVALVPDSQGTPRSVQDTEPPNSMPLSFPRSTIPASSGAVQRLVLIQYQQLDPKHSCSIQWSCSGFPEQIRSVEWTRRGRRRIWRRDPAWRASFWRNVRHEHRGSWGSWDRHCQHWRCVRRCRGCRRRAHSTRSAHPVGATRATGGVRKSSWCSVEERVFPTDENAFWREHSGLLWEQPSMKWSQGMSRAVIRAQSEVVVHVVSDAQVRHGSCFQDGQASSRRRHNQVDCVEKARLCHWSRWEKLEGIRLGRLTALKKPDGGVRWIVVGDIMRRFVARTIAKQVAKEADTAPFRRTHHADFDRSRWRSHSAVEWWRGGVWSDLQTGYAGGEDG